MQHRRDEADRLAAERNERRATVKRRVSGCSDGSITAYSPRVVVSEPPPVSVDEYVAALPTLRRQSYEQAQADWDTGTTAGIVEGCNKVIALIEEVLTSLTRYYPAGHFHRENYRDYIYEQVASRSS